jgi:type IV pilus biogenesis protein CpaD/CtpE
MNGIGPSTRRSSTPIHLVLGLALVALLAACGGTASGAGSGGGGGGGGGGDYDSVIAVSQAAFGNTMISGTVENGDTLRITLTEASGGAMAKLFLCSNVRNALKAAGLGASKVIIVNATGTQLATQADCKG